MRFLAQCANTVFSQPLLLKQFPLSLSATTELRLFTLPRHSITDWDMMVNMFYRRFYVPQPIHLDARTWEGG